MSTHALRPCLDRRPERARHAARAVLGDTIQPFPSFSGIYDTAVKALRTAVAAQPRPTAGVVP